MCEAVFGTQRRTFATEWFNVLSLSCKEHRAKVGGPKESEYLRRYADKQSASLDFRRSPPPPERRTLRVGYPERFPVLHHSVELGSMGVRGAALDMSSPQKRHTADLPLGGDRPAASDPAWLRSPSFIQTMHLDEAAAAAAEVDRYPSPREERTSTHVIHMSMPNAMRLSQVRARGPEMEFQSSSTVPC